MSQFASDPELDAVRVGDLAKFPDDEAPRRPYSIPGDAQSLLGSPIARVPSLT